MSKGTTLRNVRIDDERWDALGKAADREGTDRSALIRAMIDEKVAAITPPAPS